VRPPMHEIATIHPKEQPQVEASGTIAAAAITSIQSLQEIARDNAALIVGEVHGEAGVNLR
jgi:hypothetical protein